MESAQNVDIGGGAGAKIMCSVPILTLNSKANLEKLLPLLVNRFDDVYILDGNSTDGTQEYARSLGVRVEQQFDTNEPNQKIEDFAAMRKKLWSKAKHGWMLTLDSDEIPTPEMLEKVERVIAANDTKTAYRFQKLMQLPDGRVIRHAFFYPDYYIRVLHRSTGITFVDRKVHERLIVPNDVTQIDEPEALLAGIPGIAAYRKRQRWYLSLEGANIPPTWHYLFRWIIWYNLRSLAGQFLRAVRASARGRRASEFAMPWKYNFVYFEYRILNLVQNTRRWFALRRSKSAKGADN